MYVFTDIASVLFFYRLFVVGGKRFRVRALNLTVAPVGSEDLGYGLGWASILSLCRPRCIMHKCRPK